MPNNRPGPGPGFIEVMRVIPQRRVGSSPFVGGWVDRRRNFSGQVYGAGHSAGEGVVVRQGNLVPYSPFGSNK